MRKQRGIRVFFCPSWVLLITLAPPVAIRRCSTYQNESTWRATTGKVPVDRISTRRQTDAYYEHEITCRAAPVVTETPINTAVVGCTCTKVHGSEDSLVLLDCTPPPLSHSDLALLSWSSHETSKREKTLARRMRVLASVDVPAPSSVRHVIS